MKRSLIYILGLILLAGTTPADDAGLVSPFHLGAGAKELSLGGSDLAGCDPVTASFWNPSVLAGTQHLAISAFHCPMYDADVSYQYFGMAIPTLDWGSFGIGIFRLGISGIEKRDVNNILLDEIEDNRLALYLAYGRTMADYNIGLSLSLERHSLDNYRATSSPGVSLSIGRKLGLDIFRMQTMSLSMNLRNIVKPGLKLVDETVSYPFSFDLGMSFKMLPTRHQAHQITFSTSMERTTGTDPDFSFGAEYNFDNLLYLRGGSYNSLPSFGCGLSYKLISFDYALVERDLGSLHMFSLTTFFGSSVSQRRNNRTRQRENSFNNLMNMQLNERNQEMVRQLVNDGKNNLNAGDLDQALSQFDRALFLARANNIDTTEIYELASEARQKFNDIAGKRKYAEYMSSAQAKFDENDFLSARYLAELALATGVNQNEAIRLSQAADSAIEQSRSQSEMIEDMIIKVDSLLNYEQIEQALTIAHGLIKFAPDNQRVTLIYQKTLFEYWRGTAEKLYANGDYDSCIIYTDSALTIFPGHKQCLSIKLKATQKLNAAETGFASKASGQIVATTLGSELRKRVDEIYQAAQDYFENGNIDKAVENWEEVNRLAPNYLSVREYLVRAYKFIGIELYGRHMFNEAIDVWDKAARLQPENAEIKDYINRTKNEIRKLEELSYEHR